MRPHLSNVVAAILENRPITFVLPAFPGKSPNPSKVPWYFLGLQEMLVYFDPWLAGVVLPGLIIAGLICIPYVDKNPKGNGYYTFTERKAEIETLLGARNVERTIPMDRFPLGDSKE